MIKTLAKSIREYKLPSILTLIFIMGEVVIEVLIPFITADLVNRIKAQAPISDVIKTGAILIAMALVSLACGGIAALTCAKAATGFAKNLRRDMVQKIQSVFLDFIRKIGKRTFTIGHSVQFFR